MRDVPKAIILEGLITFAIDGGCVRGIGKAVNLGFGGCSFLKAGSRCPPEEATPLPETFGPGGLLESIRWSHVAFGPVGFEFAKAISKKLNFARQDTEDGNTCWDFIKTIMSTLRKLELVDRKYKRKFEADVPPEAAMEAGAKEDHWEELDHRRSKEMVRTT